MTSIRVKTLKCMLRQTKNSLPTPFDVACWVIMLSLMGLMVYGMMIFLTWIVELLIPRWFLTSMYDHTFHIVGIIIVLFVLECIREWYRDTKKELIEHGKC